MGITVHIIVFTQGCKEIIHQSVSYGIATFLSLEEIKKEGFMKFSIGNIILMFIYTVCLNSYRFLFLFVLTFFLP